MIYRPRKHNFIRCRRNESRKPLVWVSITFSTASCIHLSPFSVTVAPRLIFSTRNEIKSAAIKATDNRRVAGGLQGAVGLDLDIGNNYVYWCDLRLGTINRACVDIYNGTEVVARDLGSPLTLTIDWIGRKIYWTNNGVKKIGVSEMDGTSNMDLVHLTAGNKPRAIACDPKNG